MNQLVEEEKDADDSFWGQDFFREEANDKEFSDAEGFRLVCIPNNSPSYSRRRCRRCRFLQSRERSLRANFRQRGRRQGQKGTLLPYTILTCQKRKNVYVDPATKKKPKAKKPKAAAAETEQTEDEPPKGILFLEIPCKNR